MNKVNINQPIFVIGVGRSGTTLVQSMLNSHQDITFTPEIHFIRFYIANNKFDKIIKSGGLDGLSNELRNDKYICRLDIELSNILDRYRDSKQELTSSSFYRDILIEYASIQNKSYIGDKDPRNIEFLTLIYKMFPEATIIHMIRDPRDVIFSRMNAEWSKGRTFYSHVFAYYVQSKMGKKIGLKLFRENYHEILYEDLLANPNKEMRDICKRIGIPFDQSMLNFQESAKKLVSEDELKWKKESLGPLLKNNKGKWKSKFSKWQVIVIETTCNESIVKNNYKKLYTNKDIPLYQIFTLYILKVIFSIMALLYRKLRVVKLNYDTKKVKGL